jgi:hypothetical protein
MHAGQVGNGTVHLSMRCPHLARWSHPPDHLPSLEGQNAFETVRTSTTASCRRVLHIFRHLAQGKIITIIFITIVIMFINDCSSGQHRALLRTDLPVHRARRPMLTSEELVRHRPHKPSLGYSNLEGKLHARGKERCALHQGITSERAAYSSHICVHTFIGYHSSVASRLILSGSGRAISGVLSTPAKP